MASAIGRLLLAAVFVVGAGAASAHTGPHGDGLAAGFAHPFLGLDHMAAMVAVGLWGATLGRSGAIVLPLAFPVAMILGGALGLAGVTLPGVEAGIAASVVVLGLAVAMALRPALPLAAALVGGFALFHGYAHAAEMPVAAHPALYALGFVAATALLHLAGLGIGLGANRLGTTLTRVLGGGIALAGLGVMSGAL